MASIVRICFALFFIASAGLGLSGCSGNSGTVSPAQNSPANGAATSAALAISGQPTTTTSVNAEYSFRPAATDAPEGVLTFAIQNAPAWAVFDPATGTLSGKPAAEDVGTYHDVAITVSDGTTSAALAPFSITVTSSAAESHTLSWTEPTINTNGTANTDLAGYHVYYGKNEASLTRVVDVNKADVTSYVFNNLAAGTWYFAVAAFNKEKVESALSAVVNLTL